MYYCGREYQKYTPKEFLPYLLVVIDANEASIGLTDGDKIQVLWSDTSSVPRKQDAGGMSNRRYERGRENDLQHWLRSVVNLVEQYCGGRELIVGGPGMTKDKFIKELPARIKVNRTESVCYTCDAGLYELMKKEHYVDCG